MCDRRPATLAICPGRGSRRCLIPASGYFEWATIAMPDKPKPLKQPFYITRRDGTLDFAGLWERWKEGMLSALLPAA
ncbi:MAG: SOS response-associated peptidase family protein [Rhodomicrobium sp.]